VNNLPKVVTQRHLEQNLNSRPVDRKPKRLTRCITAPHVYQTISPISAGSSRVQFYSLRALPEDYRCKLNFCSALHHAYICGSRSLRQHCLNFCSLCLYCSIHIVLAVTAYFEVHIKNEAVGC